VFSSLSAFVDLQYTERATREKGEPVIISAMPIHSSFSSVIRAPTYFYPRKKSFAF
jgi:hypothetical protein